MVFVKDDWRRLYERYLLEKAELQNLPRWQGLFQQTYVSIEGVRRRLGIPDDVRDLVEYRFLHPQDPPGGPPKRLVGVKKPEEFPTPGKVLKILKNGPPSKVDFLKRWYREYRFFCDFSHCGMGKLQLTHLYGPASGYSNAAKDAFYDKEVQNAVAASFVATASVCTELVGVLEIGDVDRIAKLTDLWDFLRQRFLLAKTMWTLRAQHLLPPDLGLSSAQVPET